MYHGCSTSTVLYCTVLYCTVCSTCTMDVVLAYSTSTMAILCSAFHARSTIFSWVQTAPFSTCAQFVFSWPRLPGRPWNCTCAQLGFIILLHFCRGVVACVKKLRLSTIYWPLTLVSCSSSWLPSARHGYYRCAGLKTPTPAYSNEKLLHVLCIVRRTKDDCVSHNIHNHRTQAQSTESTVHQRISA